MKLGPGRRRWLHLQNAVFTVLLIAVVALAAWLSQRYVYTADWTEAGRNTLAPQSEDAIDLLDGPVQATAYMGPDPVQRETMRDLVERYRRAGADVALEFVNPETNPGLARELGIRPGGELVLRYGEREQRLQQISEQTVSSALLRLARETTRWVVFMQGHGERDPHGEANFDLRSLGQRAADRGMEVQTLNLARTGHIPDNTDVLVIASPRDDYLPGEVAMIRQYVRGGGNLLWLTEPLAEEGPTGGRLRRLATELGILRYPGVVVDPTAQLFGTETPDFAVVARYGDHPVTGDLSSVTLFPQAAALKQDADGQGWSQTALLRTRDESWAETGPIRGTIRLDEDAGDTAGPLTVGIAATRGEPVATSGTSTDRGAPRAGQRVAVIGDGDFLSNAYVGNGANLDFGMRLLNWLAGDDEQVQIASRRPSDITLAMSQTVLAIVGLGFLVVVPLALVGTGAVIAFRRRRR